MKLFHKVLLVDDDPASIYLNELVIEELAITEEIIALQNGADALKFIEKHCIEHDQDCPNLIILDVHMPVLDGIELLSELKNRGKVDLIKTKVVVLTSSIYHTDMDSLNNLGVVTILGKTSNTTKDGVYKLYV